MNEKIKAKEGALHGNKEAQYLINTFLVGWAMP